MTLDWRTETALHQIASATGAYEVVEGIFQTDFPDTSHVRFGVNGNRKIAVYGVGRDTPAFVEFHAGWQQVHAIVNLIRAEHGLAPRTFDSTTYLLVTAKGGSVVHHATLDNLTDTVRAKGHLPADPVPVFAVTVEHDPYSMDQMYLLRDLQQEFLATSDLRLCNGACRH